MRLKLTREGLLVYLANHNTNNCGYFFRTNNISSIFYLVLHKTLLAIKFYDYFLQFF